MVNDKVITMPKQTKSRVVNKMKAVENELRDLFSRGEDALLFSDPKRLADTINSKKQAYINCLFELERLGIEEGLAIRRETASRMKAVCDYMKAHESDFRAIMEKYKAIWEYNQNELAELEGRLKRLNEITGYKGP